MKDHLELIGKLKVIKKFSDYLQSLDNYTAVDFWDEVWRKTPEKEFLVLADDGRSYTYKEANLIANRIAHWAYEKGVREGDTVSLMKENCPEFILVWLGIAKLGAATALINYNLSAAPLANCLKIAADNSKGENNIVIYGPECMEKLESVIDSLEAPETYSFYMYDPEGTGADASSFAASKGNLSQDMESLGPEAEVDPEKSLRPNSKISDPLFYIYTSGTTGLPKAAKFNHQRFMGAGIGFNTFVNVKATDKFYCPLPVYHSSGGALGVSCCMHQNLTFVLRKKFSASKFFKDCHDYNCTVGQYIGELCKYLLATPPSEFDTDHKVRMLLGNGIRKDDYIGVQKRFKVKEIGEFYASTEGNVAMCNYKNKPGAVGYWPWLIYKLAPFDLIKMDPEDEETPLRNKKGMCIKCKKGETGQLIGLIKMDDPTRRFDGYTDEKASKKKILHDVFKKGDMYFATGDLMKRDQGGFMYFVDRIGDTFRWKGENCSTREIEDVLKPTSGISEINVYGVLVKDQSGRAGMASIQLEEGFSVNSFNFGEFYSRAEKSLAGYQRPLFVRIAKAKLDTTNTFKHKKTDLRKEGFDPSLASDPLFFIDTANKTYVPLTEEMYEKIQNGEVRV